MDGRVNPRRRITACHSLSNPTAVIVATLNSYSRRARRPRYMNLSPRLNFMWKIVLAAKMELLGELRSLCAAC